MARTNGNLWKIISVVTTLVVLVVGAIFGYANLGSAVGVNSTEIAEIKPDVKRNSEYRIQDKIATEYIKEKISNIETVQRQILEEVRK